MLTDREVLDELQSLGKEQTRKTYRRHGITSEAYGVLFGDLKKLQKKIKIDHALAKQLWESGNHDARIFALMIADPKQADDALLDSWILDLGNYVLSDSLSGYAAKTPLARQKMEAWTQSDDEWIGTVGWNLLAHLAMEDKTLPDSFFLPYLDVIERDIHTRKNRVRYSMNNALIAIGGRNATLAQPAIAAAGRIGYIEVDHGDTNCETPDAIPYIQKMQARKN